jgi:hypothetical protein
LIEQLQQSSYAIGQQMYAQQQATAGGPVPGQAPDETGPVGDDFVEGEFREV